MAGASRPITVIGAGFVGLTTGALLANAGYTVYLIELNARRLASIKQGKSFFYEEGIDALLSRAVENGSLIPTDSYDEAIAASSHVFSCVGTPDRPDGSSNLDYIFAAAHATKAALTGPITFIQKSTVPPGTGRRLETEFADAKYAVQYVSNPEFLRESTAVFDTLFFDRVVVGGDDDEAVASVVEIYKTLESHRIEIADYAEIKHGALDGEYLTTGLADAELIKVASNSFLSVKISFANFIAMLADECHADASTVLAAMGADPRIGERFLNPGRGYGGGCFPKDVSGLIDAALNKRVDTSILESAQKINERMPGFVVESLRQSLGGDLSDKRIALLGLAFKSGTSDVRKSPAIAIANKLSKYGADVYAFDPEAAEETRESHELWATITIADSLDDALNNSDAVVIGTAWDEFKQRGIESLASASTTKILFDADNAFKPTRAEIAELKKSGITYQSVGRQHIL